MSQSFELQELRKNIGDINQQISHTPLVFDWSKCFSSQDDVFLKSEEEELLEKLVEVVTPQKILNEFQAHCVYEANQLDEPNVTILDYLIAHAMENPESPVIDCVFNGAKHFRSEAIVATEYILQIIDPVAQSSKTMLSETFWKRVLCLWMLSNNFPEEPMTKVTKCDITIDTVPDTLTSQTINMVPMYLQTTTLAVTLMKNTAEFWNPETVPEAIKTLFKHRVNISTHSTRGVLTLTHMFGDRRCKFCNLYSQIVVLMHRMYCRLDDCFWSGNVFALTPESRIECLQTWGKESLIRPEHRDKDLKKLRKLTTKIKILYDIVSSLEAERKTGILQRWWWKGAWF